MTNAQRSKRFCCYSLYITCLAYVSWVNQCSSTVLAVVKILSEIFQKPVHLTNYIITSMFLILFSPMSHLIHFMTRLNMK